MQDKEHEDKDREKDDIASAVYQRVKRVQEKRKGRKKCKISA